MDSKSPNHSALRTPSRRGHFDFFIKTKILRLDGEVFLAILTKFSFWFHKFFNAPHPLPLSLLRRGVGERALQHIVTTNIEHASVLEVCKYLERTKQAEVTYVEVENNGIVDPKKIKKAIRANTVLVSVMYANNEVGTIEPIFEIAKIISDFKKGKGESQKSKGKFDNLYPLPPTSYPLFHTDAVQAFNYLNCNVNDLGVDLMTLSAQKIYGPKGVGLLYVKGLGFRVKGLENQNKKNNLYPNPYTLTPTSWHNSSMPPVTTLPTDVGMIFWFFFAIALVVTAYFVFAELFHWLRFGFMYPLVWIAIPVYLTGIVILIGGMLTGIGAL